MRLTLGHQTAPLLLRARRAALRTGLEVARAGGHSRVADGSLRADNPLFPAPRPCAPGLLSHLLASPGLYPAWHFLGREKRGAPARASDAYWHWALAGALVSDCLPASAAIFTAAQLARGDLELSAQLLCFCRKCD
ncbi:hypothetical protein NDU88_012667 [Pleurodeles waltl]|uniref:Uncharacterized protein n=1 Tax=Pleurodeles waltl TaxID=8319 RepID=A0AAV7R6R6_PLEWA|nr:hypothetical protein NDU88_012667 [Pleurodeles waltl]